MSCNWLTMPMIGPCPRRRRDAVDGVGADVGTVVDHDDLDLDALRAAASRTPSWMRSASSRNVRPSVADGPHQLGRVLDVGADDADLDAVDRRGPSTAATTSVVRRSPSRRCWRRGTGSWPAPGAAGVRSTPEVELVVAVAGGVEPPHVLDVDRRLVLEQRRVGRRCADVVARRQQQRLAGEVRCLLVEQRRQLPRATDGERGDLTREGVAPHDRGGGRFELTVEVGRAR